MRSSTDPTKRNSWSASSAFTKYPHPFHLCTHGLPYPALLRLVPPIPLSLLAFSFLSFFALLSLLGRSSLPLSGPLSCTGGSWRQGGRQDWGGAAVGGANANLAWLLLLLLPVVQLAGLPVGPTSFPPEKRR